METKLTPKPTAVPLLDKRQYELIVNSIIDYAIYMLDPDGIIVSCNAGAERLNGYKSTDILGKNFEIFFNLEDRYNGVPKRALQEATIAGRFTGEGWRLRQDGSRFWASGVIDPVYGKGKLIGFAKVTRDVSKHRESELALEKALERLLLATESGGIGIWDWDIKADVLLWDDLMYQLYGLEREADVTGYSLWQKHLHPDDLAVTQQAMAAALSGIKPFNTQFRIVWKDGSIHHLRGAARVTRDANGQALRMIGSNWDITELKRAESKRDEVQAQVAGILENMRGYIFERAMSPDGRIYYNFVSESLFHILGLSYDPASPQPNLLQLVSPLDRDRVETAIRQSARDFTPLELELRFLGKDGQEIWVTNRSSIRKLDDGTLIWDGFGTDISAEKRAAEQLFNLTYLDKLTGIENRVGFEIALENAVREAQRNQAPFVVFFIDIADFRAINDTLGVKRGDHILRQTAQRLQVIAGDDAVVARIGGDEFAVLKCSLGEDSATLLAVRICAQLGKPIRFDARDAQAIHPEDIEDVDCKIEVNIGIASFPDGDAQISAALHEDAVAEYMKRSDIALHEAKRLGHGKYSLYSHDIDHRIRNRTLMRQSLHAAVANQEFIVFHQPVVDFQSAAVIGAEALLRWQHPKLGLQMPSQFIPLAEESGLIVPLGAWVLESSMNQIRHWRSALGLRKISVNVSSMQFSEVNFLELMEHLLRETGASPDMIELELTETTLIDCSPEMLERMNKLRSAGFTIAIDDFGTGYSSLKYLSRLPLDKLKIDQFFVRQMVVDSSDASIVRAIVGLGQGLNLEVVAEGVETESQKDILIAEGCLSGQGFLFSKPLTAEDFEIFVKKTNEAAG
jgi:diguanylate cyclase (GGDEF)-like protein/PAS domain S-box-containing protein